MAPAKVVLKLRTIAEQYRCLQWTLPME